MAPPGRRRADDDPLWVWRAARWTAAALLAPVVVAIAWLIVAIVIDVRASNSPDRVNDDGHGSVAVFAFWVLILLLPALAAGILAVTLAAIRTRASLWFHAVIGTIGALVALSAVDGQPWAWFALVVFGAVAAVAINSIVTLARR